MEPWLDSLSDDWDPQPAPSSHVTSLAPSTNAHHSRASRIPRYISPQKQGNRPCDAHDSSKPALLKTRQDDNEADKLEHLTVPSFQPQTDAGTYQSNSSGSIQSVVKHSGTVQRPVQVEVKNPDEQPETPNWKQLALRQQDLFSPSGLENIFQKPERDSGSSPLKQSLSFGHESSYYPSSPPIGTMPTTLLDSAAMVKNNSFAQGGLSSLEEQDEDLEINELTEADAYTEKRDGKGNPPTPSLNTNTGPQMTEHSEHRIARAPNDLQSRVGPSKSSSSVTDGFSPVFISKHNTVDGRVDYVAFDPAHLPKLSEHVNLNRGGQSNDSSFRNKPLSSTAVSSNLPSDSIAPSDSVSQVRRPEVDASSQDKRPNWHAAGIQEEPCCSPPVVKVHEDAGKSDDGTVQHNVPALQAGRSPILSTTEPSVQTVIERDVEIKRPSATVADAQTGHRADTDGQVLSARGDTNNIDHRPENHSSELIATAARVNQVTNSSEARWVGSVAPHCLTPPSMVGTTEEDAHQDDARFEPDSSTIAKRDILRPRNPTPWHGKREDGRFPSVSDGIPSPLSTPGDTSRLKSQAIANRSLRETAKARVLASEAATFRIRNNTNRFPGDRKKSVSTQDYLNEAMRIMDLIRARKRAAESDLSSNTGADSQVSQLPHIDDNVSVQTLSRPPSREGPRTAWRSQVIKQVDPRVESQLRRYEETGDESFLVSSIVRSVHIKNDSRYQYEQDGVRITDNPHRQSLRRNSDPENSKLWDTSGNRKITCSSNPETDDSGRTQKTSSTQKMSSIGRIAPEQVSHLIRDEAAGMRYDTNTKSWVKCKPTRPRSNFDQIEPSSTTTEDDPLAQIPDLSVHDQASSAQYKGAEPSKVKDNESERNDNVNGTLQSSDGGEEIHDPINDESLPLPDRKDYVALSTAKPIQEEGQTARGLEKADPAYRTVVRESHDDAVSNEAPMKSIEPTDPCDTAQNPRETESPKKEQGRRREQSVFFSSPPVSREWEAKHWTDSSDPNRTIEEEDTLDPESSHLVAWEGDRPGATASRPPKNRHWSRNAFMSHSHNHQEISFIEHRPDGRTLSLSMSMTTPGPSKRYKTGLGASSVAMKQNSFMQSLSPLSDFSVSNDDQQHVQRNALAMPFETVQHGHGFASRPALTTNELVGKLTDAEPDEPYWDFMHRLNLAGKNLDTLNMLNEFCPRLEELDASCNKITHLQGAPDALRHLNLSNNQLGSLTDLSHLKNLQYVNLANNSLKNLDGFSNLTHLRELRVDRNEISGIEGILDLDGLLTLDLRRNKLKSIDLSTAQLRRLTDLDLSENSICSVKGLSSLKSLSNLNLSNNALASWPTYEVDGNDTVLSLNLSHNQLTSLSIANLPALQTLNGDNNALLSITGVETHARLQILHLAHQTLPHNTYVCTLDTFSNLTQLHLSGTPLPALFPLTVPFLNLSILDVSFTGLQALPSEFGMLVPHLRTIDLSFNSLKDLRSMEGIVALRDLRVSNNRIGRLRKFVKVLSGLGAIVKGGGMLEVLDCRNNPLTTGFYAGTEAMPKRNHGLAKEEESPQSMNVQEKIIDEKHLQRLDEETQMKRRVYEMLVGVKCAKLRTLDGLEFDREKMWTKDKIWERLVEAEVVQRVGG